MGCGVCCLKCLLILFNTFFGIIGLVMLAAGAFILASASKYLQPYLDEGLSAIPGLPEGFNLQDYQKVEINNISFDIAAILKPVAIFLIIFGLILVICAIFGSCGSCCSNKIMLYIYAALVGVLLLCQIITVALFFSGALDKTIKSRMKKTITNDYVAVDDTGLWSLAWNALMTQYKCCGVEDYKDFAEAVLWKKVRKMDVQGITREVTLVTPFACCKFAGSGSSLTPVDEACCYKPADEISNWSTGCYAELLAIMDAFYTQMIGAVCGLLIFQALCVIAAIVIALYIQKEKDNQV